MDIGIVDMQTNMTKRIIKTWQTAEKGNNIYSLPTLYFLSHLITSQLTFWVRGENYLWIILSVLFNRPHSFPVYSRMDSFVVLVVAFSQNSDEYNIQILTFLYINLRVVVRNRTFEVEGPLKICYRTVFYFTILLIFIT